MATQVLIAHTGQRLGMDTTQFSALDDLKAWIARQTSIPAHQVVALTAQGRSVKLQTLHQETEIYIYDIRISQPNSPNAASSPKSELPLPKRYAVPNAPNYIGNIRVLSEWQALYKERQAWARGIVDDSARMAAEIQERYSEMDVMVKCLDAAVANLEISVKQIEPKYAELKKWVEPALGEYEQLAENWENYLTVARSVPISAAMVRFMTSRDLKKKPTTLEDLIDNDTAKKSGRLAPTSLKKFTTKATDLEKAANKMYGGLEQLIGDFDNLVGRSALSHSGEAQELLQDVEAVAKKIDTDYHIVLEYQDTQPNVLQASRTAENHTSRLIPSLKKRSVEMDDMLLYVTQARNTISADSTSFMRNITEITTLHSSVKNQINVLNQAEDDMTTFDYLRLIHQLPYMYASFVSEAVRRREWSDKIKTDSSTLANEMALFQDEESKRRRKWHKMVGSMYGSDKTEANVLGLEVNLLGEEEIWPSMVKRDLEEFLEHLQKQQAEVDIIEDVMKLVNELSSPTKQQSKRLKAFKNGSVHEAALGRSGLMIRGDDELLRSLQDDKSKLENKLKTAESRVRRLEDLLHRQSAASRPGIGGLFGHERNGSTNSIKSTATVEDHRRSTGNSEALMQRIQQLEGELNTRRASDQSEALAKRVQQLESELEKRQASDDTEIQQRIQHLESELNAEKEKSAAFEKDLSVRATAHDDVKDRMEEANSTKKELLENMEALQREFGLKARIEDTEDEIENFGESRENEKATYIERMHELEAEAQGQNESLDKQLQTANDDAKKLAKVLGALRDDLNDLIDALIYRATDVAANMKTLDSDRSILKADLEQADEQIKNLKAAISETKSKLATEEDKSRHLKENLDGEKARLDQLRAKIADGETGSEGRISSITEELASRQSQVGSLEEELRLYKEKMEKSQSKLSADLTQRLYSQNDRLCRLLERLGFSKVPSQSTIRRSGMLASRTLADSTDLGLLYWMNSNDADAETEKYEAFMTRLGTFDMDLFAETVYKRVKDVEHLARKLQRDARAYREKAHTLQRDSHEKIAFKHFKEGDLALFLPTRNQTAGAWAAFNTDAHRLRSREWLVARITRVQERVVDLSKSMHKQLPDTDSLSDGLRWYLIDAHEDKPGAPATPGLGKSTIATNNTNGKDKQRANTHSIEGSRRSSSNSKRALPFAGNALGSETNSLRAVALDTPTETSHPEDGQLGPSTNGHEQSGHGQADRPRSPEVRNMIDSLVGP
ncbi:hypothetical protein BDP81DRAFT_480384 [Colletotrichum phormii]|uniref:Autophagy-related protein 11 n=1 Tax=Colletotrichum phormii TaxID=359342 RepID=A0AAI9ZV45_9PEZI|nr:uncharacterized protein BDP81DRAFT_480384 [Colletotrichum phormii]KAK1638436.1 hypothetical protein BDP81DRAFT_480384 [Colletotrichum phormii]